jgi:hypothetical protein
MTARASEAALLYEEWRGLQIAVATGPRPVGAVIRRRRLVRRRCHASRLGSSQTVVVVEGCESAEIWESSTQTAVREGEGRREKAGGTATG